MCILDFCVRVPVASNLQATYKYAAYNDKCASTIDVHRQYYEFQMVVYRRNESPQNPLIETMQARLSGLLAERLSMDSRIMADAPPNRFATKRS